MGLSRLDSGCRSAISEGGLPVMSNCGNKDKARGCMRARARERGKRTEYPTDRARLTAPSSEFVCWEVVNSFCAELTGV